MRAKVSLKCQIIKATYLRSHQKITLQTIINKMNNQILASIETTMKVILNIRVKIIGSRAVILQASGAHRHPTMLNLHPKTATLDGKSR